MAEVKKTNQTATKLKNIMITGNTVIDEDGDMVNLVVALKNVFGEGATFNLSASNKVEDSFEVSATDVEE